VAKLNIFIPQPLEIVWAMMRPINPTGDIRKTIFVHFIPLPTPGRTDCWWTIYL
jgi:hypothetical protein